MSPNKFILFLAAMYMYCIYSAMSNCPNKQPKFIEKKRNKDHSYHFQWCPLSCLHYTAGLDINVCPIPVKT